MVQPSNESLNEDRQRMGGDGKGEEKRKGKKKRRKEKSWRREEREEISACHRRCCYGFVPVGTVSCLRQPQELLRAPWLPKVVCRPEVQEHCSHSSCLKGDDVTSTLGTFSRNARDG